MISAVIPAYNEELAIAQTVQACRRVLDRLEGTHEVIVVDDGSSDKTAEIAAAAGAKVVRHPHNLGYGRSLKDGILAASHDTIVISDADGTYPIDRIPDLFEAHRAGFDMVVGARQGKHYDESLGKKLLRLILKHLVEFTAGREIPDINSGLRIFSRQDILPYFQYLCETFSFTTSLTLAYMLNGKFVKYIPIDYQSRVGATKVRLFRDSLRTLQFIVEAILYFNPIKIFIVFCGAMLGLAAICFVDAAVFGHYSAFLLGIGCVLLAFLMFGIGLVSIQLKQLLHLQDTERTVRHRSEIR
jgi:glycosyltransferase involved in cell wall biosynthesis